MKDYYKILELEKGASDDEIKKNYRKLALKHHPDKGGNSDLFKEITEAYETLSDPEKRRLYDNPQPSFGNGQPFGNDFFTQFFNQMNVNTNVNRKMGNHVHQIRIKLKDVYTGLQKTLKVNVKKYCLSCKISCNNCGGNGNILMQHGPFRVQQTCPGCGGSGIVSHPNVNCMNCNGKGEYIEEKICKIDIPKGMVSGNSITIEGLGEQPRKNNDIPGDLLFQIMVEDDTYFRREGNNLLYNVDLTFKESIIGKNIVIPHYQDNLEIDTKGFGIINPLIRYSISGKGILDGDLILVFNIKYPEGSLSTDKINKFKEIDF